MAPGPAARKVGPQLSELELPDSDSSVGSILGVCLHGFDGDTWTSDAEEAQDAGVSTMAEKGVGEGV